MKEQHNTFRWAEYDLYGCPYLSPELRIRGRRLRDVNMPAVHVEDISPERVGGFMRTETQRKYLPGIGIPWAEWERPIEGSGGVRCQRVPSQPVCRAEAHFHREPCTP